MVKCQDRRNRTGFKFLFDPSILNSANLFSADGLPVLAIIGILAIITSTIHGATGVAGGFLLSAAIAPIIGIKPIVPTISVALLISHSSRALMNYRNFDRKAFLLICLPAIPCIVMMAFIYGRMSSQLIAVILGITILASIPIRRWANHRKIHTSNSVMGGVGAIYGGLSGVSIGPGMLLVPFMLGYGLTKEAFVATLAAIALVTNITRVSIYGGQNLLDGQFLYLGIFIGLMTIPGNWFGRAFLRRMTSQNHTGLVDILTIVGALNFFWLAFRS